MVLECSKGKTNTAVAAELRVSQATVGKWRSRFLESRLDGLVDEARPGRPRTVTDADVERVVTLTLETTPKDATHWSTRSMARRSGLSHNTVSRIWRAFALQPHRTETFKLSADPLFIEKVLGLYLNPPDRALVLATRSPRSKPWTAPGRFCPCVRARPSGAPMITCATDHVPLLSGQVIGQSGVPQVDAIESEVPAELDVHLIADNYATHKTALIRNWFAKRPRFHIHSRPPAPPG